MRKDHGRSASTHVMNRQSAKVWICLSPWFHRSRGVVALALAMGLTSGAAIAQAAAGESGQDLTADGRPAGGRRSIPGLAVRAAPGRWSSGPDRLLENHPRAGHPAGNLGKDYPAFKLPFTPAGEKAYQYDLTQTRDPEALCILGGAPRLSVSGMAFEIQQTQLRRPSSMPTPPIAPCRSTAVRMRRTPIPSSSATPRDHGRATCSWWIRGFPRQRRGQDLGR